MKILYFGDFDPNYARNKIIINGLHQSGVKVLLGNDCSESPVKYLKLFRKHKKLAGDYGQMIVGYSDSRWIVPFAKLITRKKVIWDAFYSIYDSWVFDRKLVPGKSWRAKLYWFLDWLNCKMADFILLDTYAHINYFARTFNIKREKFIRVLVGAEDFVFYPKKNYGRDIMFNVLFFGKFIPLQGVEYIIQAAKLLEKEKISFTIIGDGQEFNKVFKEAGRLQLKNTSFIGSVPYQDLPKHISRADLLLGIFGNTAKAGRVIPNKAYDTIAMAKPLISGDSPAIRELFTDRENILLCNMADAEDLAEKILELKNDSQLRTKIAQAGYELYKEKATPLKVVLPLVEFLKHQ